MTSRTTTRSDLESALVRFGNAKMNRDEADEEFQQAQDDLIKLMGKQKSTSGKFVWGGDIHEITATVVAGERIITDEVALKKRLGQRVWDRVTVKKLDKAKLEDAIAQGEVDATVVAACCEAVPNKVYVKPTIKRMFKQRKPSPASRHVRRT
jgi:hypothetical protein